MRMRFGWMGWLGAVLAFGAAACFAESESEICNDGQDNDQNGATDCDDSNCAEADHCLLECQDPGADGCSLCLSNNCMTELYACLGAP